MRSRLRTLRDRDPRLFDAVVAAIITVAIAINVAVAERLEEGYVLDLLLFCPIGVACFWRRSRPLVAVTFALGFGVVAAVVDLGPPAVAAATMTLVFLAYSVGAHSERSEALIGLALGVAAVAAICILDTPNDVFFPVTFFWLIPWACGRVMRTQTQLARELTEAADRAERDRELKEGRAVAEERRRVARELHDVLAHDLSVMVVQAGAARRVLAGDPERAADAARLIERTGREALAELRHLFGPVRRGEGEPLEGSPSVGRVDRLVGRAREAGLPVELVVEGEPGQLPPGVDLAGYRVVQEALTNTLRHAGAARASVVVRYTPAELVLEIVDDGVGTGAERATIKGSGMGLIGMQERVALYGGRLDASRRDGGGFAVRAEIPLNGGR